MQSLVLLLRLFLCFLFRTCKHSITKTGKKTANKAPSCWNNHPSHQLPVLPLFVTFSRRFCWGLLHEGTVRTLILECAPVNNSYHDFKICWTWHGAFKSCCLARRIAARWLTSKLNPFRKHPVHWSTPSSWLNPSWSACTCPLPGDQGTLAYWSCALLARRYSFWFSQLYDDWHPLCLSLR